jgi:hypothetical protein
MISLAFFAITAGAARMGAYPLLPGWREPNRSLLFGNPVKFS